MSNRVIAAEPTSRAAASTSAATRPQRWANQPDWVWRGHRAIPKVDVPRARVAEPAIMDNLRPYGILLVARPLAALATFIAMAANGWWLLTPLVVWFLYGSTLSAVHHFIHGSVGLSSRAHHFWLSTLACIVGESGHALQATHVVHHRDGSDLPDPEGYIEYLSWREMPVGAAKYRYRMALWGLRYGNRRRLIAAEMGVHAAAHILSLVLLLTGISPVLWIYLSLIHVASFAFAILQGKGPQANFGRDIPTPLLLVHTKLLPMLFFNHHQHLEHHAWPKVPMPRLGQLRPHLEASLEAAGVEVVHLHIA